MNSLIRILAKGRKKRAGFTLVELMIVVIIVGILAAAAVPIYRFALKRAYTSEAKASLGAIRAAELVHQAEHDTFLAVAAGNLKNEPVGPLDSGLPAAGLGIDVANNTWFNDANAFSVIGGTSGIATDFIAKCDGSVLADSPVTDIKVSITEDGTWGTF